jgi:hypothetical protein
MPHLDSVTDAPQFTGPTRDMHAITAKDAVWRQERFQMTPKRLPVSLRLTPRPKTHKSPVVGLQHKRVPVLVRSSNNRPQEAGDGDEGGTWSVSDPGNYDGRVLHGIGADPVDAANTPLTSGNAVKLAVVGGLALLACVLACRGKA